MDIIYEIRRRHSVQKQTITAIARDMGLSRPTVRKHLNTAVGPKYERTHPKLGQFEEQLTTWMAEEAKLPRSRRRSAHRLFEGLQEIGYSGAYDSVQRFVKRWKSTSHGPKLTEAFVPLIFQPGDACQFDWSYEQVELGGVLRIPMKPTTCSIRKPATDSDPKPTGCSTRNPPVFPKQVIVFY